MEFNIQEWNGISSTSLSDAMAGCQTMAAAIKPLDRRMTVTGPAYTIQIVKNDCSVIFKALREAPKGAVLVIAAHGTTDAAFLGEIVVTIAKKQGLAGIVIDGCVRDSKAIADGDFPVFARGITPKSPSVNYLGRVQQTVVCADTFIRPGDIVYGDADGVVVIPADKTAEVLKNAKSKEEKDRWKMDTVIPDPEALDKFLAKASGEA